MTYHFEWDEDKNNINFVKHKINFYEAQKAFFDKNRVVLQDLEHSENEDRYFCLGEVGKEIVTVRFTIRDGFIRIFGAGYWRKGRKIYEQENKIHRR